MSPDPDDANAPRTATAPDGADMAARAAAEPEMITQEERRQRRRDGERRIDRRSLLRPGDGPMVIFEKVTKKYGTDTYALRDVSVSIDAGEFVFLVGPSGSGKSTFIRMLTREVAATSGRVTVGGRDLSKLRRSKIPQLRRGIGCVFQDYKLLPGRTVYENVAYALMVTGDDQRSIRRKVPEILSLVGLADKGDRHPNELSGGEQQRVSIARAFVNHPRLLIADEPTGNLDPETSIDIMQLLYRIHRTGTTVVMATHDRELVDKMQMRVIALEDGRIVRDQRQARYARVETPIGGVQ